MTMRSGPEVEGLGALDQDRARFGSGRGSLRRRADGLATTGNRPGGWLHDGGTASKCGCATQSVGLAARRKTAQRGATIQKYTEAMTNHSGGARSRHCPPVARWTGQLIRRGHGESGCNSLAFLLDHKI